MTAFTGDIQILLYTEEENFSVCRDFYQTLLGQKPYYSWNESAQDCGAKFRAGRGTISVLCQAHDRKTGPCDRQSGNRRCRSDLSGAYGCRRHPDCEQACNTELRYKVFLLLRIRAGTGSTCITAITEFRRSCGSADT